MRTLVLNAGFEPLAVVSFRRALVLVMNDKATVLASDGEHPVFGIHDAWDRPSVIVLRRYVRIPHARRVPLTRRGVLRRDGNLAQALMSAHLQGAESYWKGIIDGSALSAARAQDDLTVAAK